MLRSTIQRRCFSLSRPLQAHMRRAGKADESPLATAFKIGDPEDDDVRTRRTYDPNPEVPNLMSLEKRWNTMDSIEQEEVILYLDDRSRGDWKLLTDEDKKAMWFINFGPWGPRSAQPDDPGRMYGHLAKVIAAAIVGLTGYKVYESQKQSV